MIPRPFLLVWALAGLLVASPGATAAGGQQVLPPSIVPDDLVAEHDVVIGHGGSTLLHAEVIQTRDTAKRLGKAIIYVHGGGWASGTNEYDVIRLFYLARAGYLIASVEYRLSGEAKWPAQIEDCKLAVRWLRANAAHYKIDPGHLGIYGHSAGGHLVACLGTMDEPRWEGSGGYEGISSRVQAVVDASGSVDLVEDHFYAGSEYIPPEQKQKSRGLMEALLGATYSQNPALYREASPIEHVSPAASPFFIVNGEKDPIVSPVQAANFASKLGKAGVPVEHLLIKNANHGLGKIPDGLPISPSGAELQARILVFYGRYLN